MGLDLATVATMTGHRTPSQLLIPVCANANEARPQTALYALANLSGVSGYVQDVM